MIFVPLFFLLPLAEIFVFIQVGGEIGVVSTILLCILSAIVGALLVQYQGIETLARARESLNRGTLPGREIFDGLCIALAGILMMTPGFITDTMGFFLLIPPARKWLMGMLLAHAGFKQEPGKRPDNGVIEGTYERVDDRKIP